MTTAVKIPCLACIEAEIGQKTGYTQKQGLRISLRSCKGIITEVTK